MTNYLEKNRPFPLNPDFVSTPVLDDASRELIWERVVRDGETIKAVSAEMAVDLRRVSAIVRLKQVEKDWLAKVRLPVAGMLPGRPCLPRRAHTTCACESLFASTSAAAYDELNTRKFD